MVSLPTFFVPKRHHFGLSLGRTSLRAVELDSNGQIHSYAEVLLPDDVYSEGILIQKDQFILSLRKLLEVGRFTTPFVAVCFSEAHAYSREYSLPMIPILEIHEAVSWHVKDLFPLPIEELYFDWKLVETTTEGHRVVVVAVQKKLIDPLVDALVSSGLKPLSFEPGSSTIARLLRLKNKEQALVGEVNRKGAYVSLVEAEKAIFTTVIQFTADDTPESYLTTIYQAIDEIRNFYTKKGIIKAESTPIILTGEVANDEVAKFLTNKTSQQIKILSTQLKNPAFNKAYAIAATKVAPPLDPYSINLLPLLIQKRHDNEYAQQFYISLMARVIIFVVFLLFISISLFVTLSLTKQSIDARVKQLTTSIDSQRSETRTLLLLNSQAKNIVNLAPLRKTPQDQLIVIQELMSEDVAITSWEYDDSKLLYTLNGISQSREALLSFKSKLEESAEFTKISLPLGSLESAENVKFKITFVTKK